MEYADNALFENAKDCTDSTITGLAAGTYYVRVKASDNYEASKGATVSYGNSEGSYTESAISYIDFTNGAKTVYYKISMDGYNDMTGSATITIEKRDVTIKVDAKSKAEGSADPEFTGTVTGLLNDTDLGTITYKRDDADKDKEEVGADISIIAEYTENSNYDVAVTPAKLTIAKSRFPPAVPTSRDRPSLQTMEVIRNLAIMAENLLSQRKTVTKSQTFC